MTTGDARPHTATVLVVDDDERVLAGYRRGFEHSFNVLAATDIAGAIELAKEHALAFTVLDLHLTEGSSIKFIRQLRHAQPGARIVLVSGYLTTEATVTAVHAGAHLVLDKPVAPREILRRLDAQPALDVDRTETPTLAEAIDAHIARVYADCGGNVSETARRLGLYRSSLQRRLNKRRVKLID
ncbi:MAG TPA: response regulator [Kofleriaceae bacterium]|nr:response regulator [Kofleriaceae bacterium]